MKPEDIEWAAKELMPLVADENGNSLWDIVSLMPQALYAENVPILARSLPFTKAVEVLRELRSDKGLNCFAMWPSWAYLPNEFNIDNENNYATAQYYQSMQSVAHLLPKQPTKKEATTKKRGKKR